MIKNQQSAVATTVRHRPQVAANPIPYWAKDGKSKAVFEQAFADFADIGFTAVKADVPEGMTAAEYATWIDSYGLSPSLSLFSSPFDETIDIVDEIERAKRFAADQVELGLDRTMISSMAVPARMAEPAVGADFNADRLALAIENCGIICQVLQSQGLRPLHHSHIGGVFETEREITQLLDTLGADVIGFGPDTGHLRWAGIDPAALITRYADRIGGIHIKDVFPDYLTPASRQGLGYREVDSHQTTLGRTRPRRGRLRRRPRRHARRLRRRLHDRNRRTERGIPLRLPPDVVRLGQPGPQLRLLVACRLNSVTFVWQNGAWPTTPRPPCC